jgi:triphosphatase
MKVPADQPKSATVRVAAAEGTVTPGDSQNPPGPSALELALSQLRLQLATWELHQPGARLGADPEQLHGLRVAVRRIDAILALFQEQLPKELVRTRSAAKGLVRTLGAARDFDVQLAELERYCTSLPAQERQAAAPLRERLEADRTRARARLVRALDSDKTRQWLRSLALGTQPADSGVGRAMPAVLVMPERIRKRYRKLRKEVRNLRAKSGMEEYHLVRRRAKLLRYALEPGAALFGKPAEALLKSLRRLQDGLGQHQDAFLAKSRLEAIAAEADAGLPPETLFLMGRLAEHHLVLTAATRKTLARTWDKVRGKRWKALRAKMEQAGAAAQKHEDRAAASLPLEASATPAGAAATAAAADAQAGTAPIVTARPLRH